MSLSTNTDNKCHCHSRCSKYSLTIRVLNFVKLQDVFIRKRKVVPFILPHCVYYTISCNVGLVSDYIKVSVSRITGIMVRTLCTRGKESKGSFAAHELNWAELYDQKSHSETKRYSSRASVSRLISSRKLAYDAHAVRKQGSCLEKEIMQGTMPDARRRGRPRTAWMDNVKTWTGLPVEESVRMTEDRDNVANRQIEDG